LPLSAYSGVDTDHVKVHMIKLPNLHKIRKYVKEIGEKPGKLSASAQDIHKSQSAKMCFKSYRIIVIVEIVLTIRLSLRYPMKCFSLIEKKYGNCKLIGNGARQEKKSICDFFFFVILFPFKIDQADD